MIFMIVQKIKISYFSFISLLFFLFIYTSCVSPLQNQMQIQQNNARIYYEIFPASFYDSNHDQIGDLKGIIKKLPYLSKILGIKGIWLMPIFKSFSYHKYDVVDYMSIDSDYGSLEDLQFLANECKKRDIHLILDLAINHTSHNHVWFKQALSGKKPYVKWYNFSPHFKSDYHNISNSRILSNTKVTEHLKNFWYEGHFGPVMPDLNLDNEELRAEILKICSYWLSQGVQGFRLDAVHWYYTANTQKNRDFLRWLYRELKKIKPDVYLVGEAWADNTVISELYQSNIPSFFNFSLSQSTGKLISAVRSKNAHNLSLFLEQWYNALPPAAIDAPFLTNHDQTRSAGALMDNIILQKQAAALYLLLPGSPFIYYGEEIGMQGGAGKDENKRQAFVWSTTRVEQGQCRSPVGANEYRPLKNGMKEQVKDKNSLLNFYRHVIAIKNNYPVLAQGTFSAINIINETDNIYGNNSTICAWKMEFQEIPHNQSFPLFVYHNLGDEEQILINSSELTKILHTINASEHNKKAQLIDNRLIIPAHSIVLAQ